MNTRSGGTKGLRCLFAALTATETAQNGIAG
jgi:hypothetical protein